MRISSVAEWLKSYGFERFTQIFEQNEVDLTTLRVLTESDLKELGVPFGPRKRILSLLSEERAVEKLSDLGGYVVAPIGERRQLTVLFCDLVGFTKLAYKHDPEALQIIIRSYEQACASCVNRYEGYVFRMLGDGVVAFFGFPLAHESEAERAIRQCPWRAKRGWRGAQSLGAPANNRRARFRRRQRQRAPAGGR